MPRILAQSENALTVFAPAIPSGGPGSRPIFFKSCCTSATSARVRPRGVVVMGDDSVFSSRIREFASVEMTAFRSEKERPGFIALCLRQAYQSFVRRVHDRLARRDYLEWIRCRIAWLWLFQLHE